MREGRRPRHVGAIPLSRERTPETRLARVEQVRLPADATLVAHRRAPGVDVVLRLRERRPPLARTLVFLGITLEERLLRWCRVPKPLPRAQVLRDGRGARLCPRRRGHALPEV